MGKVINRTLGAVPFYVQSPRPPCFQTRRIRPVHTATVFYSPLPLFFPYYVGPLSLLEEDELQHDGEFFGGEGGVPLHPLRQ
eukprot:scaffold20373_cov61-Isochrysis_galbana.AAC.1